HVRRPFGGAASFVPKFCEALFVDFFSGGRARVSLPDLRHVALSLQGFRWIETLLDLLHGVAPHVAFWDLFGNHLFKSLERVDCPFFWASLRAEDVCVLPNRSSSVGSPNKYASK